MPQRSYKISNINKKHLTDNGNCTQSVKKNVTVIGDTMIKDLLGLEGLSCQDKDFRPI